MASEYVGLAFWLFVVVFGGPLLARWHWAGAVGPHSEDDEQQRRRSERILRRIGYTYQFFLVIGVLLAWSAASS